MTSYALAVIRHNDRPTPAIEVDGRFFDLRMVGNGLVKHPDDGLLDILSNWGAAQQRLGEIAGKLHGAPDEAALLPALEQDSFLRLIERPTKMIFAGLNYHDHLRDDAGITDFDKSAVDPLFFLKHPGALAAPGQIIPYPRQTRQLDWEVELVVIFGKAGRHIKAADAMDYVAGYSIGLDLSARDWQMSKRHMRNFDLFGGKAFDNSSPVGPKFVPAAFMDPANLPIKLRVNGEVKQNSSTDQMIWSIAELVEAITQHMAIEPGDMLFSGSPAGVGFVTNTFLKPGDRIEAEIEGLGMLITDIAQEDG